uniref:Beta-defensin-like domain-containing protein n=1 Tax=Catharus ustulatus TaxID=91951 RepID=A0A8C3U4P1_CATUS
MKIFSFFFAVLLLMLQGTSGKSFLRAPNTEVQCKQAGGVCSKDQCPPPHTRPFGRCQQGIPCYGKWKGLGLEGAFQGLLFHPPYHGHLQQDPVSPCPCPTWA